jgi:sodium/proline symporter
MNDKLPFIFSFIIYACAVAAIAVVATRYTKNLADYVLGGRKLSGPVTALAAGASDMSGWLLMALPGLIYVRGLEASWITIALVVGAWLNWKFVAPRLRVYTEVANNSLTLPAFFMNRFEETKYLRVVTSIAILIFFTFYSVASFNSGALLLQSIFSLDYLSSLLIIASAIVLYTAIGGFLAVSWIDCFQGLLMFVSLITVPVVTIVFLGGYQNTIYEINKFNVDHLSLFANLKPLTLLSLAAWGLGYFGQPHILTRFMAIKHHRELPVATNICMSWMILSLAGAVVTGLVGVVFFLSQPLEKPDTVFIILAQSLFKPWVAGILISAVLSAIMSAVSSQILMSASILVEDFYRGYFRKKASNTEYVWAGRALLVLVASVAIVLASNQHTSIFQAVGFAWSGLGASFGPVTLFSLFWPRMNKYGAIVGIISGALMVLFWGLCSKYTNLVSHPDLFSGIEILPAFMVSSALIIITSLLTPAPSSSIKDGFDAMKKKLLEK